MWTAALETAQAQAAEQLASTGSRYSEELREISAIQQASLGQATGEFESLSTSLTAQWQRNSEHMDSLAATLRSELSALRTEEAERGSAAVDRLTELHKAVASHLSDLGRELEEPMKRLIETAAETPRAAAEVIAQLRDEISNNIERDNSLLAERQQTMENLHALSRSLEQSTREQREALSELVNSSTATLTRTAQAFSQQLETGVSALDSVAGSVTGNAVEMSSLGEAFGHAVTLFDESNRGLVAALSRIEEALQESSERSDEQMGYYVAQAREIIDQSLLSQQELLQRMDGIEAAAEPAGAG
jgi:hypothetical protein